jgi:hypothetical protein
VWVCWRSLYGPGKGQRCGGGDSLPADRKGIIAAPARMARRLIFGVASGVTVSVAQMRWFSIVLVSVCGIDRKNIIAARQHVNRKNISKASQSGACNAWLVAKRLS